MPTKWLKNEQMDPITRMGLAEGGGYLAQVVAPLCAVDLDLDLPRGLAFSD